MKRIVPRLAPTLGAALIVGCAGNGGDTPSPPRGTRTSTATADVLSVRPGGVDNAYSFAVQVRSPDIGCERYADWWEVVTTDGVLAYRRILLHSHVDEQPFTRSGGPIAITEDTVVWVRAHLNTGGYGASMRGSVAGGFTPAEPGASFAAEVQRQEPQPDSCAF